MSHSAPPEFSSRQWKPHRGEVAEKCPYFLAFEGLPKNLLTFEQKISWKQAVLAELERYSKSPYKRFHESFVYETVVNTNHRQAFLDKVFQKQSFTTIQELSSDEI